MNKPEKRSVYRTLPIVLAITLFFLYLNFQITDALIHQWFTLCILLSFFGYLSRTLLNQARTQSLLAQKSCTDPLTGLYNKTHTEEMVNNLLRQGCGMGALFMLDIDDFKRVNDTCGHAYGDELLTEISAILKKVFRANDIVGRIGGDEFIIFLPNLAEPLVAQQKATDVCRAFSLASCYSGKVMQNISCSVGVVISKAPTNFTDLYIKADHAMYEAKAAGKNCYRIYSDDECAETLYQKVLI